MNVTFSDISIDEAVLMLSYAAQMKRSGNAAVRDTVTAAIYTAPTVPAVGAEKSTRKPRTDAGKPRGPNARTVSEGQAGAEAPAAVATPSPAPEGTTEPAPAAPTADVTVTIDAAREALKALNDKKGMDACFKVLGKFLTAGNQPAQRVKDLLPQDYAQFVADCAAAS